MATISVVVATYNRARTAQRAIESALHQDAPPLEVLVCDDGSSDTTRDTFEAWAARDPRVRYLGLPKNSGTPAVPRNAGLRAANGEWIAFLDDDDRWLPSKLSTQREHLSGPFDVVAADAKNDRGDIYLRLNGRSEPTRADILRDNPIILSTAIARRTLLLKAEGFPADRELAGIEDYCLWLKLADSGARFLVLPEVVTVYESSSSERLSADRTRRQSALAAQARGRWRARPRDVALAGAAARQTVRALKVRARDAARSITRRVRELR
jgi:teichuronic acid biosynthesis glycosyltransferase TuaG